MGWDGMGWDGMGWDGMGWDGGVRRVGERPVPGPLPGSTWPHTRVGLLPQAGRGTRVAAARWLATGTGRWRGGRTRGDEEVEDGWVGLGQKLLHKLLVLLLHLGWKAGTGQAWGEAAVERRARAR